MIWMEFKPDVNDFWISSIAIKGSSWLLKSILIALINRLASMKMLSLFFIRTELLIFGNVLYKARSKYLFVIFPVWFHPNYLIAILLKL